MERKERRKIVVDGVVCGDPIVYGQRAVRRQRGKSLGKKQLEVIVVSYIIPPMKRCRVVLDTNVFVSALRSNKGASYRVLKLLGGSDVEFCLSVALALEYESVMKRPASGSRLSAAEKDDILDYFCTRCIRQEIYFLWRPTLKDSSDDMVLEVAVASRAEAIVTYNKRDFEGAVRFGLKVFTPKEFLASLGGSR